MAMADVIDLTLDSDTSEASTDGSDADVVLESRSAESMSYNSSK